MRFTAHLLCLAATLAAAPALAQGGGAASQPQPLAQGQKNTPAASREGASPQFNFGLSKDQTEQTLLPIAPVNRDKVALNWKPANNWDVTLDLTSRSANETLPKELFPREELNAGVTYQVTPRFRLGGGVTVKGDSLAESLSDPASTFQKGNQASVRIESAFSF